MLHPPRLPALLTALLLLGVTLPAVASPRDTKVGDVRAIFKKGGTPLRATASALGKPVASLAYGTKVRVLEAKLPWIRVQSMPGRAGMPQSGWLRAFETVEAAALSKNPVPAHTTYSGSAEAAGVSTRQVSAAGRQLDKGTERAYRASRQDMARAYRLVDAMEQASQSLDPAESLAFIDEGSLGRRGRDYARPGRLPPSPRRSNSSSNRRSSGVGGLLGRLGGEAAKRLGAGKTGSAIAESLISSATEYVDQIKVKFTPQQEYYLGRAVAAQAIARYGIDPNAKRRQYVRLVGDAVVRLSSRLPANFGGYHFEVLDSDEVNGVSGPGGFVLLTRGAVKACKTEAELAGVLSHELAHIRNQHGEKLLRQGKQFPSLMKGLGKAAGAAAGAQGAWAQGLVRFFSQAVDQMSSTAIDHGYGKSLEFDADREGTWLLFDVFYNHAALMDFLTDLGATQGHHGGSATHASPTVRANALKPVVARYKPFNPGAETMDPRTARFERALGPRAR